MVDKQEFLYPSYSYRGKVQPKNLVFNANLQEFAHHVNYISALETNGKMSPDQAYQKIKYHWKQLKRSRKQLGIARHPSKDSER